MKGGYLVMDFADLALGTADVELDRGVLQVAVSEPMEVPMDRLSVRSRTGTLLLDRLGNASPETLDVRHRLGAARVDLHHGCHVSLYCTIGRQTETVTPPSCGAREFAFHKIIK